MKFHMKFHISTVACRRFATRKSEGGSDSVKSSEYPYPVSSIVSEANKEGAKAQRRPISNVVSRARKVYLLRLARYCNLSAV